MPCSIAAAAISAATPSGTRTSASAGASTCSAYEPGTRGPGDARRRRARPVTPAPDRLHRARALEPGDERAAGRGYRPVRK